MSGDLYQKENQKRYVSDLQPRVRLASENLSKQVFDAIYE